jgi:hypothetical protein
VPSTSTTATRKYLQRGKSLMPGIHKSRGTGPRDSVN